MISRSKSNPQRTDGENTMPKRTRAYRDSLLEDLQDSEEAAAYLNAAIEDSEEMFLIALRDVAEARQMSRVAEEAGIARESIYRMLVARGNPTLASLSGILRAVGLKLAVKTEIAEDPGRHRDDLARVGNHQQGETRAGTVAQPPSQSSSRKGMGLAGSMVSADQCHLANCM